jgi:hypothetical protein
MQETGNASHLHLPSSQPGLGMRQAPKRRLYLPLCYTDTKRERVAVYCRMQSGVVRNISGSSVSCTNQ